MTNRAFKLAHSGHETSTLLRTIDGIEFDTRLDVWRIQTAAGATSFNFTNITGVNTQLMHGIKNALAAMLLAIAPERAQKALSAIRVFLRFLVNTDPERIIDQIEVRDIYAFRESLPKQREYQLRRLKDQLLLWSDSGCYGLSDDLRKLLPTLKTETHIVGAAVRTMDPNTGPLTDLEYEGVIAFIRQAYASGKMAHGDYTLLVLAIILAARPMQLAVMKIKDFSVTERADGTRIYILQVSRIKQGQGIRHRAIFRQRELAPGVGELVNRQCDAVRMWVANQGIKPREAPIFPSKSGMHQRLATAALGLEQHMSGKNMAEKLKRLLDTVPVLSHRTGDKLKLFQTRLRRTFGTRAAAEGLSAEVIADLMDHSWVSTSLIYIETRPGMIERIDKALALQIAPLAQAFTGTLSQKPDTITGKVVHLATSDALESIGGCGKFSYCGLAAPLACYTCSFFNPWADAPHEELLEKLIVERDVLAKDTDLRIASVNDRTILAIAEVVSKCAGNRVPFK